MYRVHNKPKLQSVYQQGVMQSSQLFFVYSKKEWNNIILYIYFSFNS